MESQIIYGVENFLAGRRDIFSTFDEINEGNIVAAVNEALGFHVQNMNEEEYLYWYRRGYQPILKRHKERNSFILNKVVVNHAASIVAFKDGYFLTPAFYIGRNNASQDAVDTLNEYLYRSGKQVADTLLVDWFHTVGKAALFVDVADDNNEPVKCYALDPRSAFVVKSMRPGNAPLIGINIVIVGGKVKIDAYTRDYVYRLSGGDVGKGMLPRIDIATTAMTVDSVERNVLGKIPIIEYHANTCNAASFEFAVSLLDQINNISSNRCDGVEQFIQSLVVLYNAELPDGESADTIKEKGLMILKSNGDNRSDIKVISEELDQTQTQTLIDDLYQQVLTICAMPSTTKGGTSTSDTGAAVLARDGWYQADAAVRSTQDLFKESNRYFDEILIAVLKQKGLLDIELNDFELHFVRNETANVQSKAQSFQTLMAAGLHPELAAAKSGISNDPAADMKRSEPYIKMIWGDPAAVDSAEQTDGGEGEAIIVERPVDDFGGGV